jgi:hypothetical protein
MVIVHSGSYEQIGYLVCACIGHCRRKNASGLDVVPIADPHLSLSRPFVLRKHQILPFVTRLGNLVDHMQS